MRERAETRAHYVPRVRPRSQDLGNYSLGIGNLDRVILAVSRRDSDPTGTIIISRGSSGSHVLSDRIGDGDRHNGNCSDTLNRDTDSPDGESQPMTVDIAAPRRRCRLRRAFFWQGL